MVAPLVRAAIRCAVLAPPDDSVRHSRHAHYVGWADPWHEPEELLQLLLDHAEQQQVQPVLYYQSDGALHFVSRNRDRLAQGYRFVVADETLTEDLIDKVRFRALAERVDLPVPASGLIDESTGPVLPSRVQFPVVLKPATRGGSMWAELMGDQKALHVQDQAALDALWPRLEAYGAPFLAQHVVPGPETSIESYHCYVDAAGDIVADFTGRKLRTHPATYGQSTALVITDTDDVRALGRRVLQAVGLTGVAKCDFKRDPDGRLWLLEINPRFNLWHNPGAVAGVNLPALVHADLTGATRPAVTAATPGVSWMRAKDLQAARASGLSLRQWAAFAWRCETRRNVAWDDPMPLVRQAALRLHRRIDRG